MATRLNYVLPIARQLLSHAGRRLRTGGLVAGTAAPARGRPLIIVAGAGRSGTSAVARVLHESGVRMGSELGKPSDANPEGFYEDLRIWRLHERLLTELGMTGMLNTDRWPWRSTVLAVAATYRDDMAELVSGAADGWKDPRFAITLEAWLPLLPAPPKLVLCLRSPRAYVESSIHVFGLVDRETAVRQWARHYHRLLEVIRDYRLEATCVEYDALVERPEETTAALAEFVGHPLQPQYVNPPLRKFRYPIPKEYAALYREVLSLAKDGPAVASALADAIAPVTSSPAREQAPKPLSGEGIQAIEAYVEEIEEMVARVQASKAVWTEGVGLPRPKLVHFERLGLTLAEAIEQTRAASAAYASVVKEAQERLGALASPPAFERYHELTERQVNFERIQAELMLAASRDEAPDRRTLKTAVDTWKRFGQSSAFERAHKRREREYARALEASDYQAARARQKEPT